MEEQTNKLILNKEVLPFFNLSHYLNNITPIKLLSVKNMYDNDLIDIDIKISSDVPFIYTFKYRVSLIPTTKEIKIPIENLRINRDFLNKLSETEKANMVVEILSKDNILLQEFFFINVHPLEYFGGFQVLPELIAAYVTPNHPYIYHIQRKAIEILEKQGLKTAFEGYQSNDVERVLEMMSAIYSSIKNEEIVYSSLPPGYEETGQRLRLLNTIQKEKFANCIDLSLLFSACLEAIDLNPIIVIMRGHAFVGCWLQDNKFAEIVNDDKTAITKRLSKGIREIAVVEATSVCKGNRLKFSEALNDAESQLIEKENFILSVDLKSARTMPVRPLPLLINNLGLNEVDIDALDNSDSQEMERGFEIGEIYTEDLLQGKQPQTKQKLWERKLLDLSLRNNLLNLRPSRNLLQFVDIDINNLEDILSDGKSFSIIPNQNAEILHKYTLFLPPLHHSSPLYQNANNELKYNRLLTYYHEEDLDKILSYIHKNAKQAIEENGSSTLYLGIGLLKWFDRKTPEQARYSPILLLPVEINRRSVNSKFTLKSTEEETMVNITLLEFLRQEYELDLSVLEQLPQDEKGVDVRKVMGIFRRAIMQLKGWDVEEQLVLGNFSFSKLILWKDIVMHTDDLLKNDMVRSLVDGKLSYNVDVSDTPSNQLDNIDSNSLLLPMASDVSQMEAVLSAQKGQSFILHGPPGTGKSQTITNIIADALYHGKRVLFVSAKKAALDVVYKRLQQIGLTPFTLELHSNKSKKSDVLNQLSNSLDTLKLTQNNDFNNEALHLDESKKAINEYVNTLHKKYNSGWSLYENIATLDEYQDKVFSKYFISHDILQKLDKSLLQQWNDWLPQFQSIIKTITHPSDNPLSAFNILQYSASIHSEIDDKTEQLKLKLEELKGISQKISTSINLPFSINSNAEWDRFVGLIEIIRDLPDISIEFILYMSEKENYIVYQDWREIFGKYLQSLNNILKDYNRNIFNVDLNEVEIRWKEAEQSWFLPKWLNKRKIKRKLGAFKNTSVDSDDDIINLFYDNNQLKEMQRLLQESHFLMLQQKMKSLYKGDNSDLKDIDYKVTLISNLKSIINQWGNGSIEKWCNILQEKGIKYSDNIKQGLSLDIEDFLSKVKLYKDLRNNYENITGVRFSNSDNWIQTITFQLDNIQTQLPNLKNWINYSHLVNQANDLNLQWLITAYVNKSFDVNNIVDYFNYTVHISHAQWIISQHECLSLFNADLFESKIKQYKKIAKQFQNLTIKELRIRLASKLPNTTLESIQSSEIGILQRAIKNKGRGISIRKLFDQIPVLLPRIAPCMLMSPISVAQYFDVNTNHFDILIFDEASQLPTCEAISALARAKQCIIVGDPKQMPPTSFFSSNKQDEENTNIEDLESILDDCITLSVPSKHLLRHYRSKHESLIAFSNVNYYNNKLLTFPSADDLDRKVKYHHVEGIYDKGKTRTNKFEADAIVEYISLHYSKYQNHKLSLGVVTFSQAQQNLIEEKLQGLFMSNSLIEQLATENEEPLFIKNLENVQGDERDVILFSIGYAPDENGKMSMNFGPLNRDGGWRRLNVAVTRARYEMHIFATLKADQIDLNRTSSEGVAGLKAFLQYAEKGQLSLKSEDMIQFENKEQLSKSISKRLQNEGLQVKCNVGTSGFKIDVAVIHPDRPQEYILGIVVDGDYYYNAHTTNDREIVMPSVLKSLGWNIYRIWTIDWFENSKSIIDMILKKVDSLKNSTQNISVEPTPITEKIFEIDQLKTLPEEVVQNRIESKRKEYISSTLDIIPNSNCDDIYYFENKEIIKYQIRKLVSIEYPISKNLLYKKLLSTWNVNKVGSKLGRYLDEIVNELSLGKTCHHQPFYWPNKDDVVIDFYRNNDIEKRNIEDIAPEEIFVALKEVLTNNLSIEEEELLRYLARTFSFSKLGKQIDNILRYVIDMAEKQNIVVKENGRIKLQEDLL